MNFQEINVIFKRIFQKEWEESQSETENSTVVEIWLVEADNSSFSN